MGQCTSGSFTGFIGILGSLAIVTLLYMAVSLGITGTQSYTDIDPADAAPLATAFDAVGVAYLGKLVAIGACIGLTVMVIILRRPRPDPATIVPDTDRTGGRCAYGYRSSRLGHRTEAAAGSVS